MDLDQTIIHTTVDPTVGEWMAGIEVDEREDHQDSSRAVDQEGETTTKTDTAPDTPQREKNPNAEALRDVARFQLEDDLPPGYSLGRRQKMPKGSQRWYYTKPRFVLPIPPQAQR